MQRLKDWVTRIYHILGSTAISLTLPKKKLSIKNATLFYTLGIFQNDVVFVGVENKEKIPVLKFCEKIHYTGVDGLNATVSRLVSKYRIEQQSIKIVLSPHYYKIYPFDSLPVSKDEIPVALRWNLRKQLDYPIDDAVIDYIQITESFAKKNTSGMIYAVVAHQPHLQTVGNIIEKNQIFIDSIDIAEMGLKNIVSLYATGEESIALLTLGVNSSEILIVLNNKIYLIRSIKIPLKEMLENYSKKEPIKNLRVLEEIDTELHRSFEYYQRQFRLPVPSKLLILPFIEEVYHYLLDRSQFVIQQIDLNGKIKLECSVDENEYLTFLPSIGGSLEEVT